ncbi:hypothetical protein DFS34DRAFT_595342 [Phlyctochytrium arcticum]|nr:hypothetical protein DFS34DRAFT_595342 [Phlyctochytrium arcticum]
MPSKTLLTTLFATLLATSSAFAAPSYYSYNDNNKDVSHHKQTLHCKHAVRQTRWDGQGRQWGKENGKWCMVKKTHGKDNHKNDHGKDYNNKKHYLAYSADEDSYDNDNYDNNEYDDASYDDYSYEDDPYDNDDYNDDDDNEYGVDRKPYYSGNSRYSSASHDWKKDDGKQHKGNKYDEKYSQGGKYDVYKATLCGEKEVPFVIKGRNAFGFGIALVDRQTREFTFAASHFNAGPLIKVHIHGPAPAHQNASVLFDFSPAEGQTTSENPVRNTKEIILNEEQHKFVAGGLTYINLHNKEFPAGVVRGQLLCASKECQAPQGANVVRYVEDGVCNNAIFGGF